MVAPVGRVTPNPSVKTQVKTLALLCAVLLNAAFLAVAVMAAVTGEGSTIGRAVAAVIALALGGALTLLLMARLGKLPAPGFEVMRYLCLSVPVLWFAGSLDRGVISGQEWAFLLVVGAVTWGTWHVFNLFHLPSGGLAQGR